jgi:hypothetical protein
MRGQPVEMLVPMQENTGKQIMQTCLHTTSGFQNHDRSV